MAHWQEILLSWHLPTELPKWSISEGHSKFLA